VITPVDVTEKHEEDPDTRGAGDDEEAKHDVAGDVTGEKETQPNTNDIVPPTDESGHNALRRSHRLKLKAQRIMRQKGAGSLSLTNISIKRAIRHDPKRAAEAIHKELEQMLSLE